MIRRLIERFVDWQRRRKAKRTMDDFLDGCHYADEELARGVGADVLLQQVDEAKLFGDYNDFDRGMEARLRAATIGLCPEILQQQSEEGTPT